MIFYRESWQRFSIFGTVDFLEAIPQDIIAFSHSPYNISILSDMGQQNSETSLKKYYPHGKEESMSAENNERCPLPLTLSDKFHGI